ncbi:MAG: nicotinate-nucleotide adenylyltransferase [bacterium]|nr:nicotinate-nucleotide adenylyltransferase [bacterium]
MGGGTGILGGTFDPIHAGHLIIAQEVLDQCCLDRVVFVPCADPPHKQIQKMTPALMRAEMVELAVSDNPRFEVSRIELERPGKSYTIETLRQFRRLWGPGVLLHLIIGADNAVELSTWCDPRGVLDLAQVTVAARPDFNQEDVDPVFAQHMRFVQTPLLQISSTDIRRRFREGRSVRYLVPLGVEEYMKRQKLYGREANGSGERYGE